MTFKQEVDDRFENCRKVFWSKNAAYGTDNIKQGGVAGVLARITDKVHRLTNVLGGADAGDESVQDTCVDLANYAVIMSMLSSGEWPDYGSSKNLLVLAGDGEPGIEAPRLPGDVGYDLRAKEDTWVRTGVVTLVKTGVHFKCPEGMWAMILGRSSAWAKRNLVCIPGVIDSGYTGEIGVACTPVDKQAFIDKGERIGQAVFFRANCPPIQMVDKLPETDRSRSGFGSTGQ